MRDRILTELIFILLCIPMSTALGFPEPTETIALTAAPPYSVTGELFILKADPSINELCCPLLVVEGFDADNSMGWVVLYSLLNESGLIDEMHAFGRDLLVLNFGDSTADIIANAALTERAISYINANRVNHSDKFTAVGISLGGLTIRKAMCDNPEHDINTWISLDAPHEGANIPLGIQEYLAYFARINRSDFNEVRAILASLDTPASKQMLLVHHSAPAGGSVPKRQEFTDLMNACGYPTNSKSIAISNGSGYGEHLPFLPGEQIINWHVNEGFLIKTQIDGDIYALPQSTAIEAPVFYGYFNVPGYVAPSKITYTYSTLSLDNAPGGYRPTFYDLYSSLPSTMIDEDDYCITPNHCFIPTVSALGIPIEHIAEDLSTNFSVTALSPFDEIHYAISNERHVAITEQNKQWLIRATLEDYDSDGDGLDDYQEHLIGTVYNDAMSSLKINTELTVQLSINNATLDWDIYPNMQYTVWKTASLGEQWTLLSTIAPTNAGSGSKIYSLTPADPSGYFKVVAELIDPITN